jgi:membrane protease YdiL (CAAX protease family)
LLAPWAFWFWTAYLSHNIDGTSELLIGILSLLGLIAPLIVALTIMLPDRMLKADFLGRFFNYEKVKFEYILAAFLLMPASILLAQLVSLFFGYSTDQFFFRHGFTFSSGVFPVWFMLILAPVIEELAWHSYGTDCLRNRLSLLSTSLIFALFWGIWHLPLSFIKDYYHSNLLEDGFIYSLNFFISLFPFVIIMNWLYYRSQRNIIVPIVFHITAGYFNEIFNTHPMSKVIQTALLIGFSVYLIINDKSFFLKTNEK